jgi:hypothetical protein
VLVFGWTRIARRVHKPAPWLDQPTLRLEQNATATLFRDLVAKAEVWWCTTWRDRANNELASFLEIERLPVIDDGSHSRSVGWKPAAAHAIAREALDSGREVFWVEDFYGNVPTAAMPDGVAFIDTAADTLGPVLTEEMLPDRFRSTVSPAPST